MPTIHIFYDAEGWAYHHRARMLRRLAPPGFEVSASRWTRGMTAGDALPATPPDLIFLMPHSRLEATRRAMAERGWTQPLVGCWSVGWPHHAERLPGALAAADWIVFNNRDNWERSGRPENSSWISNGVDLECFRVTTPLDDRAPKILWAGSEFHRRLKGYDTFVPPLRRVAARYGIAFEALLADSHAEQKRSPAEMAAWYNRGTVFLCTSASEGTPNTALEAAACGCAIVSTRVGNMPELIRSGENGILVDRDLGQLAKHMLTACERHQELAAVMLRDIRAWDWRPVAARYFDLFGDLIGRGSRPRPTARADLRDAVTVFVSTVGRPGFERCLAALKAQDCSFELQVIRDVAPMSRAFQTMLDRCRTPFYVQVDEDMILVPGAIRHLHAAIAAAPADVATIVRPLWDTHLERCILGVKIYRHAIVARYPFADTPSCDQDQNRRLAADGYHVVWPPLKDVTVGGPEILGLHGTDTTDQGAYARYAKLERGRQWAPDQMGWTGDLPHQFLRRVLDGGSRTDLVALLAMVGQALRPDLARDGERDYRAEDTLPLLDATLRYVDAVTGEPPVGRD